ncbi:MAG: hypothetical protein WC022_01455 [Parcubacteria group bacterium]
MAEKKKGGFAKKFLGEMLEAGATGTAAAGVMSLLKKLTEEVATNPEVKKAVTEKLSGFIKGGRTYDDELAFYASVSLVHGNIANAGEKTLFEQVHQGMLHPDFTGKTANERIELERRRDLAKGLIFLVAHDKTVYAEDTKRFVLVNPMWKQFFSGIKNLQDNPSKIKFLEERIMRYGENHQEGTTLKEAINPVKGFVAKALGAGAQAAANRKIQDAFKRRKRR